TSRLRGLAVTSDHYLVAGSLDPAGLLVFDLRSGGPPMVMEWPVGVPFAPFDIAARPEAGAFVLDRGDAGRARVWRLDRRFMVEGLGPLPEDAAAEPPTFSPPDSAGPGSAPARSRGVTAADAIELDGDPIAIAV